MTDQTPTTDPARSALLVMDLQQAMAAAGDRGSPCPSASARPSATCRSPFPRPSAARSASVRGPHGPRRGSCGHRKREDGDQARVWILIVFPIGNRVEND